MSSITKQKKNIDRTQELNEIISRLEVEKIVKEEKLLLLTDSYTEKSKEYGRELNKKQKEISTLTD